MPMRLCSKCGRENLREAKQCIYCRQTFTVNKYVKCENCGLLMDKEASYCMHCEHENDNKEVLTQRQIVDKLELLELRIAQLEEICKSHFDS